MGFWSWFWIWLGLIIGALIVFGFIAKSLLNRASSAGHQLNRLADKGIALSDALANKPALETPENSLLADPVAVQAKRRVLQKQKIKKHEQRKRRLIASLKRFDPNESRFH